MRFLDRGGCASATAETAPTGLVAAVDTRVAATRFDRIVLGSGDGGFVEFVLRLKRDGQRVEVVSRRSALSLR
jgi:hypothetical protein